VENVISDQNSVSYDNQQGQTVAQFVEALHFNLEGHGFDTQWCHWKFYLPKTSGRTKTLGSTHPATEMSTRNISCGDKGSQCIGLTTLPPSCANCLEIWKPQPPGTLTACLDQYRDCFTFL